MLFISRRQILGLLAGFFAPDIRADTVPSDHPLPSSSVIPRFSRFSNLSLVPDSDLTDPSALEAWQRLPMLPFISFETFSTAFTDEEQFLGCVILEHIKSQTDFEFSYHGGSDPGNTRRVLPILLFQKFEMAYDADDFPSHIYLLAFCRTRQQARTFRLDRVQPVAAVTGPQGHV